MNQSFSFRMLNRWIEESESNTNLMVSKKDEEEAQANHKPHRSAGRCMNVIF